MIPTGREVVSAGCDADANVNEVAGPVAVEELDEVFAGPLGAVAEGEDGHRGARLGLDLRDGLSHASSIERGTLACVRTVVAVGSAACVGGPLR